MNMINIVMYYYIFLFQTLQTGYDIAGLGNVYGQLHFNFVEREFPEETTEVKEDDDEKVTADTPEKM